MVFQSKEISTSKYVKKKILALTFSPAELTLSYAQLDRVLNFAMERSTLSLHLEKQQFLDLISKSPNEVPLVSRNPTQKKEF